MNAGIDYGNKVTNIDTETGIRYGVISQNAVLQSWADSCVPVYTYFCPECGTVLPSGCHESECPTCKKSISEDEFDFDEPDNYIYESDGYICEQDSYGDIFILRSPYYTYAQFCSPCAPGACHLENPLPFRHNDNKCYCFGHDWFDSGKAPYDVFNVKTRSIV
jgi:hypothetical protein